MSISPLVSIIIVTWNSEKYLPACLDALSKQTNKDFEIVIVDNGSTDEGCLDLEKKYPGLKLTVKKLDANLGFAPANNIGARLARGEWLALLNADAFPEPDWLEQLLRATDKYPNAFFSSRQIQADKPDLLDGEGDNYHVSGYAWRENYNLPVYPLNASHEVFSACGAAAFYPRHEFLDAGGFDEDYFSYHEDVDLGFRLRLLGLTCMLVPQAVVHHVGSGSTGKQSDFSVYYGHRNLVWTYFKNMPGILFWIYLPLHIVMTVYFMLSFALKGKWKAIFTAKRDAFYGLVKILSKRRGVQKTRAAISVFEIHRIMNKSLLDPYWALRQREKVD
jgi:GT2 family glycosyltransferase